MIVLKFFFHLYPIISYDNYKLKFLCPWKILDVSILVNRVTDIWRRQIKWVFPPTSREKLGLQIGPNLLTSYIPLKHGFYELPRSRYGPL